MLLYLYLETLYLAVLNCSNTPVSIFEPKSETLGMAICSDSCLLSHFCDQSFLLLTKGTYFHSNRQIKISKEKKTIPGEKNNQGFVQISTSNLPGSRREYLGRMQSVQIADTDIEI